MDAKLHDIVVAAINSFIAKLTFVEKKLGFLPQLHLLNMTQTEPVELPYSTIMMERSDIFLLLIPLRWER
jgi:hypothetical protein|tara:strand:- start:419 stop:628 length:210 start_codon:yes stop_codon:yes gene_type:complete